jgi:peptidoglycan/xylan/chitin deacetylase (PgdA/CDA1 family)
MRIRGMGRVRQVARRLRNQIAPGGLILMYHRIAEEDSDPWGLCVKPQHFAQHLEILSKRVNPLPLQQLNQEMEEGKSLHRSIAITFDDGYIDNLQAAKPLLEQFDIPATVFVASGYTGQEREFWWDELERLFLQPGTLPETLKLTIEGHSYQWGLGTDAHYSKKAFQRDRTWQAERQPPPSIRHSLYRSIWKLLQPLPENERRQILDELLTWADTKPQGRATHRPLTQAEVLALEEGNLIEVGGHTVMHPFLSALSVASQKQEIQQGKIHLEQILGHPVKSFAYPYGDYTADTITVVQDTGFTCACSTNKGNVRQQSDRFQLPRVGVQDWDKDEFERRLSRWFDV